MVLVYIAFWEDATYDSDYNTKRSASSAFVNISYVHYVYYCCHPALLIISYCCSFILKLVYSL